MPIDTSSYYPETPRPEGEEGYSLNARNTGLFGSPVPPPSALTEEECPAGVPPEPRREPAHNPSGPGTERPATVADRCANILSWLLVPLMMPVYGILLIFGLTILTFAPQGLKLSFVGVVAGINLVMPMLLFVLLKRLGWIEDLALNGQRERLAPYAITIVGYLLTAWFVAAKSAPVWMAMFFCGGALAGAVNMIVNLKWKISAHAAGAAGIVALLLRISQQGLVSGHLFLWLLLAVGAAGLLGTARIWLGRHTVWQVLAGYSVGFCSVFFLMAIE